MPPGVRFALVGRKRACSAGATISALALVILAVTPALAASKPPTAEELVGKLVKAGVCSHLAAVDAAGTTVECSATNLYAEPNTLRIRAYRTRSAMVKSLDRGIASFCGDLDSILPGSSQGFHPKFRVGSYWWTDEFRPLESKAIQKAIGGTLKFYTCR